MKKILIIEDSYDDYLKLISVLNRYEIDYVPKPADFRWFSHLIVSYAKNRGENELEQIRDFAKGCAPHFIFLDLALSAQSQVADNSGMDLKAALFDLDFKDIPLFWVSGKSGAGTTEPNYIYKRSSGTLLGELVKKFFSVYGIGPLPAGQTVPVLPALAGNLTASPPDDPLLKEVEEPPALGRLKRRVEYKSGPWLQTVIDMAITYWFYLLLFLLAFLGPATILYVAYQKNYEILQVAETGFIAFLPLLVVFGFFLFYKQSLQPLITGAALDNLDYERASGLMMLTKKLFISSLISYLFTKLTELLFLEHLSPDEQNERMDNFFQKFYHTGSPMTQVYLIIGVIAALMLFYIYLNSHKTGRHE